MHFWRNSLMSSWPSSSLTLPHIRSYVHWCTCTHTHTHTNLQKHPHAHAHAHALSQPISFMPQKDAIQHTHTLSLFLSLNPFTTSHSWESVLCSDIFLIPRCNHWLKKLFRCFWIDIGNWARFFSASVVLPQFLQSLFTFHDWTMWGLSFKMSSRKASQKLINS